MKKNKKEIIDLHVFFTELKNPQQKQYEAVKAIVLDKMTYKDVATKYNYKINTLYSIIRDAKAGKLILFPESFQKLKSRHVNINIQKEIKLLRSKKQLSAKDMADILKTKVPISERTVERILKEAGFPKLKRRSNMERGVTAKGKIIPIKTEHLIFDKPFRSECSVVGIYFLLPYIIESGLIDIVKQCRLPASSIIGSVQACLSMLALKLMGHERLSTIENYDHETGLGLFAGLNVLPKATYMSTYSCRTSEKMLLEFQKKIMKQFLKISPENYDSNIINLDFHSIAHYGEKSEMEKIWCGSKHKTMKGANTVIAQDAESNMILYTRADILRKEEANEIKLFLKYWNEIKKENTDTLVFDCKFTSYKILNELDEDSVKFITLRKRSKKLIDEVSSIANDSWQKITLNIPKRKHKKIKVYEEKVQLSNCKNKFRQIIITDNGREKPTFIICNNWDLPLKRIIEIYAKRWRVENKISEIVTFFNLIPLCNSYGNMI
jgi:transposase